MESYAADLSPFAPRETEAPWLEWKAGVPLTSLCEAERAQPQPSPAPEAFADTADTLPRIQRPQYQAVLSRMRQAAMRTGTYAAWRK